MKRVFTSLILAGAVFAALSAAPQKAEAGTSIFFGFGAPAPVVYTTQPRVIYTTPHPVYYRPAPVYYAPVQQVVYRPGWDNRGWDRNHRRDRDWDHDWDHHDNDHGRNHR